ncbi:hypothetical protein [Nonomuraea rubra]|uniref:Uncharacterized protein n=1 Tax=Nonomuraea rubra TaxID=46180 RepID=A0A7X0U6E5_9ACTN|nr:hypothetical protein [Nonomuraea rubra]MBB6556544.1 hypothetical protein [Nonomuraea rubra]
MVQHWQYYRAECENGTFINDPSEDAIFDLLMTLRQPDNGFVVIEQPGVDPPWYVCISIMDDGEYELECRDQLLGTHQLESGASRSYAAKQATKWLANTYRTHNS